MMMNKLTVDKTRTKQYYTDEVGTTGITELQVCKSAAGWYIGRMCDDGPYSRESCGYFKTREDAQQALDTNTYCKKMF